MPVCQTIRNSGHLLDKIRKAHLGRNTGKSLFFQIKSVRPGREHFVLITGYQPGKRIPDKSKFTIARVVLLQQSHLIGRPFFSLMDTIYLFSMDPVSPGAHVVDGRAGNFRNDQVNQLTVIEYQELPAGVLQLLPSESSFVPSGQIGRYQWTWYKLGIFLSRGRIEGESCVKKMPTWTTSG